MSITRVSRCSTAIDIRRIESMCAVGFCWVVRIDNGQARRVGHGDRDLRIIGACHPQSRPTSDRYLRIVAVFRTTSSFESRAFDAPHKPHTTSPWRTLLIPRPCCLVEKSCIADNAACLPSTASTVPISRPIAINGCKPTTPNSAPVSGNSDKDKRPLNQRQLSVVRQLHPPRNLVRRRHGPWSSD